MTIRRNITKILTVLICSVFLIALIPPKKVNASVSGTLHALGMDFDYTYSDTYFGNDSGEFLAPLADVSLVSSIASCDAETMTQYYNNLGFSAVTVNEAYSDNTNSNKVGLVCAKKDINLNGEAFTLIGLTVRGVNYGVEWADNFNLGSTGNHQGFESNSTKALEFVKQYLSDQGLTGKDNLKIWIQGYSRGGAISYMTARKIMDNNILKSDDDLYVYTFSAPRGVVDDWECDGIHNIVNDMDFIQRMAPEIWGFKRYGETITLGNPIRVGFLVNPDKSSKKALYASSTFSVRKFDLKNVAKGGDIFETQGDEQYDVVAFYDKLIFFMQNGNAKDEVNNKRIKKGLSDIPALTSREVYATNYQDAIMYLFMVIYSDSGVGVEGFASDFSGMVYDFIDEAFDIKQDYPKSLKTFKELIDTEDSTVAYDEQKCLTLLQLFGKFFRLDSGASNVIGAAMSDFTMMSTMFGNLDYIAYGHYQNVVLAWLRDYDKSIYCNIDIQCEGITKDSIPTLTGECTTAVGTNVDLKADYDSNVYEFTGWYDQNNTLLSADKDFVLTAYTNETIFARFELLPEPTPTSEPEPTEKVVAEKKAEKKTRTSTKKKSNVPVIIGICSGSVVLAGLVAAGVVILLKKKKKQ